LWQLRVFAVVAGGVALDDDQYGEVFCLQSEQRERGTAAAFLATLAAAQAHA
jgi:hypothetical protein